MIITYQTSMERQSWMCIAEYMEYASILTDPLNIICIATTYVHVVIFNCQQADK